MSSLDCLTGKVIETSQFLAELAKVNQPKGKSILFGDKVRALKAEEIEKLKAQNNYCADWSRVLVAEGFEVGGTWGNMFRARSSSASARSRMSRSAARHARLHLRQCHHRLRDRQ
jgi:hypothetical protein